MKKAKKILALLLCAVLLVSASVAGTLAYLTDTKDVHNTFTVGNVKIKLDEALVDENGKPLKYQTNANGEVLTDENGNKLTESANTVADAARTEDGNENVLLIPGRTTVKDPTITVLKGSEDCYVRAKVTVTIPKWDDEKAKTAKLIKTDADDNADTFDIIDFKSWVTACFANEFITSGTDWSGFNTQKWRASVPVVIDGVEKPTFIYYLTYGTPDTIVVAKNTTGDTILEPLFTGVTVPTSMTNDQLALLEGMTINVEGQAIQAEGFVAADGKTAEQKAWDAFDKQMTPSTEETP